MIYNTIQAHKKTFAEVNNPLKTDVNFRITLLKNLKKAIIKYEKEIILALKKDLNKSEFAAYTSEITPALYEINHIIKNLKKWAKPKIVKTPIILFGNKSYINKCPYGVVLIISTWNYPFLISISPLIGAIAAGNNVILKLHENSPSSSEVISKVVQEAIPKKYVEVLSCDYKIISEIIDSKVDFIFFTGSNKVGKLIMKQASKYLTPVVLELGGKSPCIIHDTADIKKSTKDIVWGKLLNSGQTCIAPDYLILHESIKDEFIKYFKLFVEEFWGKNPIENDSYVKIINHTSFKNCLSILENQNVIYGGKYNEKTLKIEPTLVLNPIIQSKIMQEEIFAPILPILTYKNEEEIYNIIRKNENPLALYIFSKNKKFNKTIINNINSGGCCINTLILQISNHNLPFGGVGNSGMGNYHGKYSFETFSHSKSIISSSRFIENNFKYYSRNLDKVKKIVKIFTNS